MDSDFDAGRFRVLPDVRVDLSEYPALISPVYASTSNYHEMLREHVSELSELQQVFYADNRYAVLLIFQAMDAAGKDSCIRHVMTGINPQGCSVHSFRHPSIEEYEHDFLWRSNAVLPERGHIGIFNRSYYEEVLIARVHPEIMESEGVAGVGIPTEEVWQGRYRSINDLERHLTANAQGWSSFFSIFPPKSSENGFSSGLTDRKRTGSSAWPILRNEDSGMSTCMPMPAACRRHLPKMRPGTLCLPTTRKPPG